MRITRFPSIGETQFFGCVAAFVDSLAGELNGAAMALHRLQGRRKGAAFAYEMTMDTHRYGALIVLDRWSTLVSAFGPHLQLSRRPDMIGRAPARVQAAETILSTANHLIDAADNYSDAVVEACAAPDFGRSETWINGPIRRLTNQLFALGYGHSVECRRKGELVGGLYGIALGGAFFGESMFSLERDASKVALVHLVARLKLGGFSLLDTQFITQHLAQFGTIEIARADYRRLLAEAIAAHARFYGAVAPAALASFLQSSTQRS